MKFPTNTLAAALLLASAAAFTPSSSRPSDAAVTTTTSTDLNMAFLDKLPNPFENKDDAVVPRPPNTPPPISNEPEALFSRARAILTSDLGVKDPNFLAEDFVWIGPNVVSSGSLNKVEYLAAGKFFNIRGAFPDLDYRAHDFRLDPDDPLTVRFTARTVGTMRGELRLRSETLPPTGVRMVCPPEAISMTFDSKTGKLVKLCSGFTLDRLVGNTGGLCGVMAAATVAGCPPSEWELYPPTAVLGRLFGRSVKQLQEPDQFLAPFPETVMIQLAKGVLSSDLGTKDPDLLSDEFTFCGPVVGPLKKDAFISEFSKYNIREGLPDLEENYSNFRVDPYDPYRVWYDIKARGTRTGPLGGQPPNGAKYIGPPEAASMTFDDDGFCTRLTGGAVMDPTDCNTGGLGGAYGIFYATGVPLPSVNTRTLPQIIARAQKSLLKPLTGKDADEFVAPKSTPAPAVTKAVETPVEKKTPVVPTPPAPEKLSPIPPPPPVAEQKAVPKPVAKAPVPEVKLPTISENPSDPVSDVFSNLFDTKKEEPKKSAPKKVAAKPKPPAKKQPVKKDDTVAKQKAALRAANEKRKKEAEEAKKQAALAAAEAKKQAAEDKKAAAQAALEAKKQAAEDRKAAAEAKRQAAEEKRAAAIAAQELRKKELEEKRAAALAAKEAEAKINKAKRGATISLGFFSFGAKNEEKPPTKSSPKAPAGVPTLSKWYQNKDGSITGIVAGSPAFADGESITTSPLKATNPDVDTVVVTISGSKYFLDGNKSNAPWFSFGKPKNVEASPPKSTNDAAEKRKAALEAKKAAAEAKKAQFAAAKKAQQELAAKKRAELEAKKLEAQQKREALAEAQRAKAQAAAKQKKAPVTKKPTAVKVPAGVPVINRFQKNRDGSVTGFISGSKSFSEGEKVTTSKLAPNQKIESGNIVTTVSGSKYFLK